MASPSYTLHQWMNGQGITVGVHSTASNSPALPAGATHARFLSTVDCWIETGGDATASVGTSGYLPAFTPEYIPIQGSAQVSVVRALTDGFLYVKPCCG